MVISRQFVSRAGLAARRIRPSTRSTARKQFQPTLRRGYASGGDSHGAPSSDIPWILGAAAVTIPGSYYLWPSPSHGDASHGHGGDDHGHDGGKEHEEKEESEEPEQESDQDESKDQSKEEPDDKSNADAEKEQGDSKDDSKDESKEESASSDDDKNKDDEPKSSKPSSTEPVHTSNKKVDGVQFKGKTSAGDENNEMTDSRKREPDSKGAFKKRIDSHYQKDLGAGEHFNEDGRPSGNSAATSSNDPGGIDTKQQGISTTPTRHSTAIHEDPEKSKKGEGVPETAKSMTTVDPKRPAR